MENCLQNFYKIRNLEQGFKFYLFCQRAVTQMSVKSCQAVLPMTFSFSAAQNTNVVLIKYFSSIRRCNTMLAPPTYHIIIVFFCHSSGAIYEEQAVSPVCLSSVFFFAATSSSPRRLYFQNNIALNSQRHSSRLPPLASPSGRFLSGASWEQAAGETLAGPKIS